MCQFQESYIFRGIWRHAHGLTCLPIVQANQKAPFRLFFFQAEDGIRDVERSRGLGDVYKRQPYDIIQEKSRDT